MKSDMALVLAVAAVAGFALWKMQPAAAKTTSSGSNGANRSQPSGGTVIVSEYNGWKYYSDGTAIDPNGYYYYQGQLAWSPVQ